jgi:hypothetical protein
MLEILQKTMKGKSVIKLVQSPSASAPAVTGSMP